MHLQSLFLASPFELIRNVTAFRLSLHEAKSSKHVADISWCGINKIYTDVCSDSHLTQAHLTVINALLFHLVNVEIFLIIRQPFDASAQNGRVHFLSMPTGVERRRNQSATSGWSFFTES